MIHLKIDYIDTGFCKIVYKAPNGKKYCFQDEGPYDVVMYNIASSMGYDEPESEVKLIGQITCEIPEGDDVTVSKIRKYLEEHEFINNGES